jgi:hypothetical protein
MSACVPRSHPSPDFPTCTLNSCTSHDPPGRRASTPSYSASMYLIGHLDFNAMSILIEKSARIRPSALIVRLCLLNPSLSIKLQNRVHLEFLALFKTRSWVRSHTPRGRVIRIFGVFLDHEVFYSYNRSCSSVSPVGLDTLKNKTYCFLLLASSFPSSLAFDSVYISPATISAFSSKFAQLLGVASHEPERGPPSARSSLRDVTDVFCA